MRANVYIFILSVMILFSSSKIYGEIQNECEQAVNEVMEEMWAGEPSSDSIDEAIKSCVKFANKGDATAQYHMSMLHMLKNNDKENQESYQWTLKSANNGYNYAQFHLGKMYEEGVVVKQDFEQADYWYQKGAQGGLAVAQRKIGYNYTNNIPDGVDFLTGVNWYEKAAEQGDKKSIYFLIGFYSKGTDKFPADNEKARYWTERSER